MITIEQLLKILHEMAAKGYRKKLVSIYNPTLDRIDYLEDQVDLDRFGDVRIYTEE